MRHTIILPLQTPANLLKTLKNLLDKYGKNATLKDVLLFQKAA